MDLELAGRTAIVSGASRGMGLATAQALRAEGANVAMLARDAAVLSREADDIGGLAVPGDITREDDLEGLVERTIDAFGGIDILVLNGGGPPAGSAGEVTVDAVRDAVELLLTPFVRLVDLCLPHLRLSEHARIVAIESMSVVEPIANLVLSNAVRPGVVGYLKTLARELGPEQITVNVVAPGFVDTERLRRLHPDGLPEAVLAGIPLYRAGAPEEVAATITFLASRQAAYITGAVVKVDGGLTRGLL